MEITFTNKLTEGYIRGILANIELRIFYLPVYYLKLLDKNSVTLRVVLYRGKTWSLT
jgi:hypothetical protein